MKRKELKIFCILSFFARFASRKICRVGNAKSVTGNPLPARVGGQKEFNKLNVDRDDHKIIKYIPSCEHIELNCANRIL